MLKQGLDIRIGQSLSMTPQMQQAIRLLQLSSVELEVEIQQALEENPLLQREEEDNLAPPSQEDYPTNNDISEATTEAEDDIHNDDNHFESTIPEKMDIDAQWDDIYDTRSSHADGGDGDNQGFLENQSSASDDLQQHLIWQVDLSNLSSVDKQIAYVLISCLDEAGYLSESLEDICERLNHELLVDVDDIQCVLKFIQQLEPLGVAARDLQECLLIQLKALPTDTIQQKAMQLIHKHLDLLENRSYKEIHRRLKIDQTMLEEVIRLLRTLQPRPGSAFSVTKTDYIVPDVYVRKLHGEWAVSLNHHITPALQIDHHYAELMHRVTDSQTNAYLKGNLQQARWLIRSLENRNSTVLNVAQVIIKHQTAFMQYGAQAMKPLILRHVAEELELHESTISRVTSNKYMHTPQGIFEFKYFFSSQLETVTGSSCSSTAIRAMIKQLIDQENPQSPLSDSRLTTLLKEQGISVARRTIAKYREAMSIPPSHERKTLVIT